MRSYAVNCRISDPAASRLKDLSKAHGKSFGQILDDLILGVDLDKADWQIAIERLQERVSALEKAPTIPAPQWVPSDEPRGHRTLTPAEICALSPIVSGWISRYKAEHGYPPILKLIGAWLWSEHKLGKNSDYSGQIKPCCASAANTLLKKLNIKL